MFGHIHGMSGDGGGVVPASCCSQERRDHHHHSHSNASPSAVTGISENSEWEKVELQKEQDWPGELWPTAQS